VASSLGEAYNPAMEDEIFNLLSDIRDLYGPLTTLEGTVGEASRGELYLLVLSYCARASHILEKNKVNT